MKDEGKDDLISELKEKYTSYIFNQSFWDSSGHIWDKFCKEAEAKGFEIDRKNKAIKITKDLRLGKLFPYPAYWTDASTTDKKLID